LKITIIGHNELFNGKGLKAKHMILCISQQIRKVRRCQKGYRKSYIEEGQAMQWPNEKGQNDKQWSTKKLQTF
jgi:hypothetical protein